MRHVILKPGMDLDENALEELVRESHLDMQVRASNESVN
jgi:hypothetical protein